MKPVGCHRYESRISSVTHQYHAQDKRVNHAVYLLPWHLVGLASIHDRLEDLFCSSGSRETQERSTAGTPYELVPHLERRGDQNNPTIVQCRV